MAEAPRKTGWLRTVVDGAPAVAFLGVLLATRNFRTATWALVIASGVALALNLVIERRLAPLPAASGGLALVFGGASLYFHRADLLQMKMTIVDGLLGAALLVGLAMGRNPLKAVLGGAFSLPDSAWRKLTVRYALFWWVSAAANEWVRHTQTAEVWGAFRIAAIVAAVLFALAQTPFLMKHGRHETSPPEPPDPGF
ncbi:MAG TPA: septation protein IspZ [Caulobacteraceae bacterium]|jgi:intracellular septation protein